VLIDTHCHLYFDKFAADRDAALARMAEAGVGGAVVIGIDAASCAQACALAAEHPQLRFSVGQHPADPIPAGFDARAALRPYFLRQPRPVAIGECGLDLHWDTNPLPVQQDALRQQLELARELDVPAVIHTRDADRETCDMLEAADDVMCVLHCFNGSELLLELALRRGYFISFAGNLTFPRAQELRDAVLKVPEELLLVETDAPFLAPQPVRGQRCEPAHVAHTARALAQLRGLSLPRMADILHANSCRCFGTTWV
jgi:TatD DNase family protein